MTRPDATSLTEAADALAAAGEYAEAITVYESALRIGAATPRLHHNLGRAAYEMGEISRAVAHFERAAAICEQLDPWLALATVIPGDPAASNEKILRVRQAFAARLEALTPTRPARRRRPPDLPGGRIRVGYLSSWFDHANYMKSVWPLLRHLDRASFEVHLFSDTLPARMPGFTPEPADATYWTGWLNNEQLTDVISESGVQILVDLNGYSAPRRLPVFLESPAPITLGWFNLYATSGLPGIKYIVGDREVVRREEERDFTERVLRLPVCWATFDVKYATPPVAPPPCLRSGFLTFGSLAPQYKITSQVLDCWAAILRRTGRARFLVANSALNTPANQAHLARRFAERGVEADRLTLLGPAEHFAFLQNYDRIDVALDTFPYSGSTTTMEALWQGVPVLTCRGDRWASRLSTTLLHHARLDHFVARDPAALEHLAVAIADDPSSPERLARWRGDQRKRLAASRACDGAALAHHTGRVYRALLRRR